MGKSAGWVKGKGIGVWFGRKNRGLGQRKSHQSVVWKEKLPPGSKGKLWECGLVGKIAGWVKGKGIEVWSGGENRRLGQRERHRSVVWKEKPPLGSKGNALKCGLTRENCRLGQRGSHRSVV